MIPISAAFNRSLMHLNGAICMKFITNSLLGYIKIKPKKKTTYLTIVPKSNESRLNKHAPMNSIFDWAVVLFDVFGRDACKYPLKMISQQKQTTVFTVIDLRCQNNISFWGLVIHHNILQLIWYYAFYPCELDFNRRTAANPNTKKN